MALAKTYRSQLQLPTICPDQLDWDAVAAVFRGLSRPGRLAVFRRIVRAGEAGVDMRTLAHELRTTGSAVTVHVRCLVGAGLVHNLGGRSGRLIADTRRLGAAVAAVEAERGLGAAADLRTGEVFARDR